MNESLKAAYFGKGEKKTRTYAEVLDYVQQKMAADRADLLSQTMDDRERIRLHREYIKIYVGECGIPDNFTVSSLVDQIYHDMTGCAFLDLWIYHTPGVEEININRWDDITVTRSGGKPEKLPESFHSPQHAVNIIQRMLQKQNIALNQAQPTVLSYLTDSIRIAANVYPVVSKEAAVNASIRIVNPATVTEEVLLSSGSLTKDMLDFLIACIRYRIPICVSGGTGAGKTALLSCLLSYVPTDSRLVTLEEGSREFQLVKRDDSGRVINNVVSFATGTGNVVSLEQLLEMCLRENPDYLAVGEMRSSEAYTAAEAARTGTATYTTTHADNAPDTYYRIMELSYKKYPLPVDFLLPLMVRSFPVIVFLEQYPDRTRKVSRIIEGTGAKGGEVLYRPLWSYQVEANRRDETGKAVVSGKHICEGSISDRLREMLQHRGAPLDDIKRFGKEDAK